jgi:hypothetical protein
MREASRGLVIVLLSVLWGCGGIIPKPTPTPTPTPTPDPCAGSEIADWPWCHKLEPPAHCGRCKHQPPGEVCPIPAPGCEWPEPQCQTFTDRGGTERVRSGQCDCYFGDVWTPCEPELPPNTGECFKFPQGVPDADFTGGETLSTLGTQVNAAIERKTLCATRTECVISVQPDEYYWEITEELRSVGLWAGRHDDTPPGASDEIAVATACEGWWQSYHILNFGGNGVNKVVWSPGSARPAYKIDPKWCPTDCGQEPPEPQACPSPHPDMSKMKFRYGEHNGLLDTTLTTDGQPEYCASVGFCCTPGSPSNDCDDPQCIPRGGCPVRPECGPNDPADAICHQRAACEAELCDQQWECNGEPDNEGNPAQSTCRGHWKTWCANAPSVVAEGDR